VADLSPTTLLQMLGAMPQTGLKSDITLVEQRVSADWRSSALIAAWLGKQGLPSTALKGAPVNSLCLAYCVPNYLRSWRNRVNPNWALLGGDDNLDNLADLDLESFGKSGSAQTTVKTTAQTTAQTPPTSASDIAAMADLVAEKLLLGLDPKVAALVRKHIADIKVQLDPAAIAQIKTLAKAEAISAAVDFLSEQEKPRVIEIHDHISGETRSVGMQHESFHRLLRAAQARDHRGYRLNVWLTGPTGSGKTTAAENVAKALSLPFGSDGSLDADYKVLGFRDANGHIISTQFLDIFEKGGVYVADEIDNWFPSALLSLNAALANGYAVSPGGLIRRHPDCLVIACANTWGHGATNEYVGRSKQDAATLDRFQPKINWPVDEKLERAIADMQGGALGVAWFDCVRTARATAAKQGLKIIISPRATYAGIALLVAGFSKEETVDMTFCAGLSPDQRRPIFDSVNHLTVPGLDTVINANIAAGVKITAGANAERIPAPTAKEYGFVAADWQKQDTARIAEIAAERRSFAP
jgi:cobaltochelatase CobS